VPEYPLLDLATQRPEPGHYVYRFHDGDGLLLYIGRTSNLWERFGQHAPSGVVERCRFRADAR
jgi:predicted GIY-YIG superfamily endonuclease